MSDTLANVAQLPLAYDNYIFDLYGTLVDIHTEEGEELLWERLALFMGYYDAFYEADELRTTYETYVSGKESELKTKLESDAKYSHEASPEIDLLEVFVDLYKNKGVEPSDELALHTGQLFRVMSTRHLKLYPGTLEMLKELKAKGKGVYLLSNAQRIFTEYELHVLGLIEHFDGIMISSDYRTKKPDKRFFDALLLKYDINIGSAIYIGNDSRCDVAGAKTVGLDTFYVKSNISPEGDFANDATFAVDNFTGWKAN